MLDYVLHMLHYTHVTVRIIMLYVTFCVTYVTVHQVMLHGVTLHVVHF